MKNNKNAYEEIGEYIVNFQHIEFFLKSTIQFFLEKMGLKQEEESVVEILLAERDLGHLISIYKSLGSRFFGETSTEFGTIKEISDFITEILKYRNDIVHSFLVVFPDNLEQLYIDRGKFGKKGFKKIMNIPNDHLEIQTQIVKELYSTLHVLLGSFRQNNTIFGVYKTQEGVEILLNPEKVTMIIKKLKQVISTNY